MLLATRLDAPAPAPAAPAPAPALPGAPLLNELIELRAALEVYDGDLTSWERRGNIYPAASVQKSYDALASRLSEAATQFAFTRPDAFELARNLRSDALFVSRIAGKMNVMAEQDITFGAGWNTALDRSVRDVMAATDLLLNQPTAAN